VARALNSAAQLAASILLSSGGEKATLQQLASFGDSFATERNI
jgi:hypothetical protein